MQKIGIFQIDSKQQAIPKRTIHILQLEKYGLLYCRQCKIYYYAPKQICKKHIFIIAVESKYAVLRCNICNYQPLSHDFPVNRMHLHPHYSQSIREQLRILNIFEQGKKRIFKNGVRFEYINDLLSN